MCKTDLEQEVWVSDGGEVLVDGRVETALRLEDVVVPLALLGAIQ